MEQTELDLTRVMILLQRRYNVIREIDRLTRELEEAQARNDAVSISMVLQMRAEEMGRLDECTDEIWQMAETGREAQNKLRLLMLSDPEQTAGNSQEEKKIYEIRKKTQDTLDNIRALDEKLNRRLAGDRSYYEKKDRLGVADQ